MGYLLQPRYIEEDLGPASSDVMDFADSLREAAPYQKNEWEIAREGRWVSGRMWGGENWDWYEK